MKVEEIITNRIVELLEAGAVPWANRQLGESGMPRNAVTKRNYRGINVFIL
jgi:antirestriction protein ArdC